MKNVARLLAALIVIGLAGLLAFIYVPVSTTPPTEDLPANWRPEEGRGEYLMYAGDCMACHTAQGGKEFAGGRAIESPMGTIWSTNITPDPETGIGNWTLDQFRAAMQDGLRADGAHLYPAMPYENYRLMTERDIRALYSYFMEEVKPVKNEVQQTELAFPFNMRFGIRAWNWLALRHEPGFDIVDGDVVNRGRYLVEGAGHCAACHSPRSIFMAQDGVTADQGNFLKGGVVAGWEAPPLRGEASALNDWSVQELASYLATGRNSHSTANGEMALVVQHSLQHLTDADNVAMATFLKASDKSRDGASPATSGLLPVGRSMPAATRKEPTATEKMLTEAQPGMPLGARLYLDNCSACHFVTGLGAPEIFPELAGNSLVVSKEVTPLLSIILHGATVPGTARRPMPLVMQGYADRLNDDDVAALATFLRQSWGNDAPPVTPEQAAAARANTPAH